MTASDVNENFQNKVPSIWWSQGWPKVSVLKLSFSCITKGTNKDKNTKVVVFTETSFNVPFWVGSAWKHLPMSNILLNCHDLMWHIFLPICISDNRLPKYHLRVCWQKSNPTERNIGSNVGDGTISGPCLNAIQMVKAIKSYMVYCHANVEFFV